MTKATEKTAKETKAAAADAVNDVTSKVNDVTSKVADSAREVVMRSTATMKERADDIYSSTKKYNADLENVLVRAAHGYANILGSIADAAYANVNRGMDAAEKLAGAKSISEAMQIQSDYVREQSNCSMQNARNAFEYVRDVVTENGEALRDTATGMLKGDKASKKAA